MERKVLLALRTEAEDVTLEVFKGEDGAYRLALSNEIYDRTIYKNEDAVAVLKTAAAVATMPADMVWCLMEACSDK